MQLPQFITRALAFFDRAESHMNQAATAATELTTAKARIAELEKAAGATTKTISDLTARAEKAEGEVTQLKGDLAKEQKRANAVIAGQGVPLETVPPADPNGGAAAATETAWAKYQRLLATNPREAGAFWAQSADQIMKSRVES